MAKKNERNILFLDFHLNTKTTTPKIKGLPNQFGLTELFEKLIAYREKKTVNIVIGSKEKKELYLADIEHDTQSGTWQLLINIVDTSLADEVHRKIGGAASTRKVHSKTIDVGTEFSCHMIIQDTLSGRSYLALYEQNTNLPIKLITRYLNELFKRIANEFKTDFEIPHPQNKTDAKGKVKTINTYNHVFFNGHLSSKFKDDLNSGAFKGVTLMTGDLTQVDGYDVNKHSELKEVQIPISVDKGAILKAGGNHKWLDNLRSNTAKDLSMQEIKVSFRDDNDVSHTAEIDVNTGKLINDDKYVKKVKINGFSEPLTTSVDLLHTPIVLKMLEHL
ncbi:hypothetical protein [Psychrosphaera aestuarii]|uniref:hypothetical protein n=1 Tax=Psychrosphaera aestuarii TaxID=1266052 RepID=UPI001B327AF8|nr:hypothetical protein [Psychrosphaera aestuarii]